MLAYLAIQNDVHNHINKQNSPTGIQKGMLIFSTVL